MLRRRVQSRLRSGALRLGQSWLSLSALACVPELDVDLSRIDAPRVIAIVADPPEAEEGDTVRFEALVAGADGTQGDVAYSFCHARKPLSELGPIDAACLTSTDVEVIEELGAGRAVSGVVDRAACSSFGPRRPSAEPGQPAGRAVDPDPTGGFYQPVLAELPGESRVLGGVRLNCGLPGANRERVVEYNARHRPNVNPSIDQLELASDADEWTTLDVATPSSIQIERNAAVKLRASWMTCEPDAACTGAETYVRFDAELGQLVDDTESLFATWYATAGQFQDHRVAASDVTSTRAENRWVAPAEPGSVDFWVVLRDGRGGVGFATYQLLVE